ncbi:MAG: tetratricopeptide repeat protein [Polyangiaceae bacterium]|nr:tetratricopeptide repeat protein [Polyangiaceae bacterium]
MPILLPMAIVSAALALAGCGGSERPAESPLQYTENAKRAYEQALTEYFDRDWEDAVPMFEDVKRRYAYSRYARLAQLRIADASYEQENYAEAATAYRGFVHDYPNDPEVVYARYRIAKSLFNQRTDTLLLPPLEERDLVTVEEAYQAIRGFIQDYPAYKKRPELDYMHKVVAGLLARHDLYVARFYLLEDNFKAAVARVEHALKSFPSSGLEPEALVLLGETYLKMHEKQDARETFARVLRDYPDSAFVVPARGFLERLGPAAAVRTAKPLASPRASF